MPRLDTLRAALPSIGYAVYAIEPGAPVVLEVYFGDGTIMRFTGATETEAVAHAANALLAQPPAPETTTTAEADGIFDDEEPESIDVFD